MVDDQGSCGHLKIGKRTLSFKIQSSTSESDRDKGKVTQGITMFIVLQLGRDGMTKKGSITFTPLPICPNHLSQFCPFWIILKLRPKIMQLEGWDFSVLTCKHGSATVKQIRILIQSRVDLLHRISVG